MRRIIKSKIINFSIDIQSIVGKVLLFSKIKMKVAQVEKYSTCVIVCLSKIEPVEVTWIDLKYLYRISK